jgi:peroxiredoxin Q/BCP
MALKAGDKAPEVLGVNQDGKEIRLSDFAGKKLVLYFYPKDNTPGCTAQACSLRDGYDDLRKAGYEVLGVSADNAAHIKNLLPNKTCRFNSLLIPTRNWQSNLAPGAKNRCTDENIWECSVRLLLSTRMALLSVSSTPKR